MFPGVDAASRCRGTPKQAELAAGTRDIKGKEPAVDASSDDFRKAVAVDVAQRWCDRRLKAERLIVLQGVDGLAGRSVEELHHARRKTAGDRRRRNDDNAGTARTAYSAGDAEIGDEGRVKDVSEVWRGSLGLAGPCTLQLRGHRPGLADSSAHLIRFAGLPRRTDSKNTARIVLTDDALTAHAARVPSIGAAIVESNVVAAVVGGSVRTGAAVTLRDAHAVDADGPQHAVAIAGAGIARVGSTVTSTQEQ